MGEIIAVVSPKGGVGKTTITANLGIAIGRLGKDVLLIDANPETPNLSLHLGLISMPVSLKDVLKYGLQPPQATYMVEENVHLIPAPLSGMRLTAKDLEKVVNYMKEFYDYIFLDCPPGMQDYVRDILRITTSSLLILTPDVPTVAVSKSAVKAAERAKNPMKIILNKVIGSPDELTAEEIADFLGINVLGTIPFDPKVIEATEILKPFIDFKSPATEAIYRIAERLTGVKRRRPGILAGILGWIFGKKK